MTVALPALILLAAPVAIYGLLRHRAIALYAIYAGTFLLTGFSPDVDPFEIAIFGLSVVVIGDVIVGAIFKSSFQWKTSVIRAMEPYFWFLAASLFGTLAGMAYGTRTIDILRELPPFMYYLLLLPTVVYLGTRRSAFHFLIFACALYAIFLVRDFNIFVIANIAPEIAVRIYTLYRPFPIISGVAVFWFLFAFMPFLIRRENLPRAFVPVIWALSIMSVLIIILSGTRSYWIGLGAGGIVAFFLGATRSGTLRFALIIQRVIIVSFLAGLVIVGILFISTQNEAVGSYISTRLATFSDLEDDFSTQARSNESEAALSESTESPVLGRGIGFQLRSLNRVWTTLDRYVTRGYVHSFPIYLLLKTGVIGLGLFLAFYGLLCRRLWQIARRLQKSDPFFSDFSHVMLAVLVSAFVTSILSTLLNTMPGVIALVMLLSTVLVADSPMAEGDNRT